MNNLIKKRVVLEADYILNTNDTIRNTAKVFKVSKSTIHKDLKYRLMLINKNLSTKISNILDKHFNEKHINGGLATKEKYKGVK